MAKKQNSSAYESRANQHLIHLMLLFFHSSFYVSVKWYIYFFQLTLRLIDWDAWNSVIANWPHPFEFVDLLCGGLHSLPSLRIDPYSSTDASYMPEPVPLPQTPCTVWPPPSATCASQTWIISWVTRNVCFTQTYKIKKSRRQRNYLVLYWDLEWWQGSTWWYSACC
jgi:hypothetical protein